MLVKRKILRVGTASLAISLPSDWAKAQKLKPGDEIDVNEHFGDLLITNKERANPENIEIGVDDGSISYVKTVLGNAYKKGYDHVTVRFKSPSIMPKLQKTVDGLIGFEIIEQHATYCVIKNIAQALETEYETFIKKSFYLTLQVAATCQEDFAANALTRLAEVQQMKDSVTKYADFVKRLTNKTRRNDRAMIFSYLTIWNLEKLCNEYLYLYRYAAKQKPWKLHTLAREFLLKCNDLLRLFYEGYYEKDHAKIQRVASHKDDYLYDEFPAALQHAKGHDAVILHHCANIIRRLQDMTGPYFGTNI